MTRCWLCAHGWCSMLAATMSVARFDHAQRHGDQGVQNYVTVFMYRTWQWACVMHVTTHPSKPIFISSCRDFSRSSTYGPPWTIPNTAPWPLWSIWKVIQHGVAILMAGENSTNLSAMFHLYLLGKQHACCAFDECALYVHICVHICMYINGRFRLDNAKMFGSRPHHVPLRVMQTCMYDLSSGCVGMHAPGIYVYRFSRHLCLI